MIDFIEIVDGETWELFARDFLTEIGFYIESTPDRGADLGKDLLVSEQLKGNLGRYRNKWLVSCKHYAQSQKAINEDIEKNLLERIESFDADAFIGFYSTLPSAGLNTRLSSLMEKGKIKDFRFFDSKLIENYLVRVGYSFLMMRYFPKSYTKIKPLHKVCDEYLPIECERCKKDLLKSLYVDNYGGNIVFASKIREPEFGFKSTEKIEKIYFACKGDCDVYLEKIYWQNNLITQWEDIGDIAIPMFFLRFVFGVLNASRDKKTVYSDEAYEKLKYFIMAMGQKVLRETTVKEMKRTVDVMQFYSIFEG